MYLFLGYENLNLKHNIPQDLGNIPLEINYIEGKNLGVTKSKLKVEVGFVNQFVLLKFCIKKIKFQLLKATSFIHYKNPIF
jgi:hypothetical protein